jgi:hypothetical protein
MMKLGIFGDQTTNHELLEQLNTMSEVMITGLFFSGNATVPEGFPVLSSPIGLMDISDAILILSDKNISNDLVKLILRKSKHIYLKSVPSLQVREIKELIDLEKEAGIVTFIYNPFNYNPYFDPFSSKYEKPFLINIRTCFEGGAIKASHETLLLVTALNRLVQSNYKKLDVYGSQAGANQLIISFRIEYENGCVVNLTLSQEAVVGYCEIFQQSGRLKFEIKTPLLIQYPQLNQEITAVNNFIRLILDHDKKNNSFDNLLNGIQIVHEIKEHLRFNGIDF